MNNNKHLIAALSVDLGFLEGLLCDPVVIGSTERVIKKRIHDLKMLLINEGVIK